MKLHTSAEATFPPSFSFQDSLLRTLRYSCCAIVFSLPLPGMASLTLEVDPMGLARKDYMVEVDVPLAELPRLRAEVLYRAEDLALMDSGSGAEVPFQLDFRAPGLERGMARLYFLLEGETAGNQVRRLRLDLRAETATSPACLIETNFSIFDEDQPAIAVNTPAGEWIYHYKGAGFSSLHDIDGKDWLNYRPGDGPRGEFRGIPNMGYPEGYMHAGKEMSDTIVESTGPLRVSLYSESRDGKWAGRWEIFPHYAKMTVLRTNHPFWFLYEGTPGGTLEPEEDFWIKPNQTTGKLTEFWRDDEQPADWIAFADGTVERSILLLHEVNQSYDNSYWLMQEAMTVFGFGRRPGLNRTLTETPRAFYVALMETRQHADLEALVRSLLRPAAVRVVEVD